MECTKKFKLVQFIFPTFPDIWGCLFFKIFNKKILWIVLTLTFRQMQLPIITNHIYASTLVNLEIYNLDT